LESQTLIGSPIVTDDITHTVTIPTSATQYVAFAYQYTGGLTGYNSTINQVQANTSDGYITACFNPSDATDMLSDSQVTFTNSAGYASNYKIIVSKLADIDSTECTGQYKTLTSTTKANFIFWGTTTEETPGNYNETFIESSTWTGGSNQKQSHTSSTLSSGTSYSFGTWSGTRRVLIAYPKRLGTKSFTVTAPASAAGFGMAMNTPTEIDITNPAGFKEAYYVYQSAQALEFDGSFSMEVL